MSAVRVEERVVLLYLYFVSVWFCILLPHNLYTTTFSFTPNIYFYIIFIILVDCEAFFLLEKKDKKHIQGNEVKMIITIVK